MVKYKIILVLINEIKLYLINNYSPMAEKSFLEKEFTAYRGFRTTWNIYDTKTAYITVYNVVIRNSNGVFYVVLTGKTIFFKESVIFVPFLRFSLKTNSLNISITIWKRIGFKSPTKGVIEHNTSSRL